MSRFIYVFSAEARDSLISRGYIMLKEDKKNCVYIFMDRQEVAFDSGGYKFVFSNTLTF